jgi:hypothetical protein
VRVLWITGAPGAGKSATGFQIFTEFTRAGRPVAYVDIDQLGMCFPPPANDPDRERLKVDALLTLLPHYDRTGAEVLVVSGVLDPDLAMEHPLFASGGVSLCRLVLSRADLDGRLLARGVAAEERQRIHHEAADLERRGVGARVDASGAGVREVAARVLVVTTTG